MKKLNLPIIIFTMLISTAYAGKGAELYKACIRCHGENGEGKESEKAPQIAGQYNWYLLKALSDFKSGERKNPTMLPYISNLSQLDFEELANYVSQLKVK
jgi:cytochrome c553